MDESVENIDFFIRGIVRVENPKVKNVKQNMIKFDKKFHSFY